MNHLPTDPIDRSHRSHRPALLRRRLIQAGCGALLVSLRPWAEAADADFPTRPITFLVPFPAGGPTDALLRSLTAMVGKSLGQSFVIENRPGGSTTIAAGALARAKPDGYTLGVMPLSLNRLKLLGTTTLDVTKDFTPIARVAGQTYGMVVRSDSPYKTVADVVKAAKAKPGTITFGTSGIASPSHVGMEDFMAAAGISMNHIPFKGSAETLSQLLGGQIDMLAESAGWATYVDTGKMRALCVWNEQRHPRLPDVPTLKELGYNVVLTAPFGLGAPAGLEPHAAAKLGAVFRTAILSPEFKVEADKILAPVMYQDAESFRKFALENLEWERQMIERLHLKEKLKG